MYDKIKYGMPGNLKFYCKESFCFQKSGLILSLFIVPARIIKSLTLLVIPKIVIDSIGTFRSEFLFLSDIIFVTAVLAVASVMELLAQNTMEHNMNAFVLIRLNRLWMEKVSVMDYEVFTSETGKQASGKARMTLEGTTRWGIGTYIPALLELVTSVIGFLLYGVLLVSVHPAVLAALLAAYAVHVTAAIYAEKKKQALRDDAARAERKMNYFAYHTRGLSIAKDIRAYGMREWVAQMATMARLDKKKVDERIHNYQAAVLIVNGIVVLVRDSIVYLILLWLVLKGDITIGNFALYAAAVNGLGDWLARIATGVGAFWEADHNVTDFRQFLDLPDGKTDAREKLEPVAAPGIELDHVSFSYDSGHKVLDNISLKVRPGEKIAVVGTNGAGKTTLIKLICGLLHPTDGQIRIDGIALSSVNQEDCAKVISAVFQDSALLPVSIKRNIIMNEKEGKEDRLSRAVTLAGLDEKIASLELGMETPLVSHITENGTEFSGGEVQKLLLARAIYKDSPVLILDEPTAAMDPIAEQKVYLKYHEMAKDKTAFFISHRLSSTRFCDRILLIDGGRIKEAGTHEELMKKGGMYADMYLLQSRYYQEGGMSKL